MLWRQTGLAESGVDSLDTTQTFKKKGALQHTLIDSAGSWGEVGMDGKLSVCLFRSKVQVTVCAYAQSCNSILL